MQYGVMLPGGGHTIAEGVEIAQAAEARGFASAYCVEAFRSAFVPLAAVAAGTHRIRVGPYILNAWGRSPWLSALSAVDLDELSGGRLLLGVGPGNKHINEDMQGLPFERPAAKMGEYVELLRQMVAARPGDAPLTYEGDFHSVTGWVPNIEPVRPRIPVYAAAIAPAMRRMVGRVADGAALGTLLSPAYVREQIRPDVERAAAGAGRDPAELGFLMAYFVSYDEDREVARMAARRAIVGLYAPLPHPYYDFLLREQGFAAEAASVASSVAAGRPEEACEAVTDELLDTLTASGDLEDCRRSLARFDGLVDEVILVNARGPLDDATGAEGDGSSPVVRSYVRMMRCAG